MRIIGVDPGPTKSALAVMERVGSEDAGFNWLISVLHDCNDAVSDRLWNECRTERYYHEPAIVALEAFRMQGVRGEECMYTILWTGRFIQRIECVAHEWQLIYRDEVRKHLCPGCKHVGDPDVRSAIIDRFGGSDVAVGKKASPGPLYAVKGHAWAALAVALVAKDRMETASSSRGISSAHTVRELTVENTI